MSQAGNEASAQQIVAVKDNGQLQTEIQLVSENVGRMSLINRTVDRGCAACDEERLNHVVLIRAPYEIDGGADGEQAYGIVEFAERLPSEADKSAMGAAVAVEVLIIVNFGRGRAVAAYGGLVTEVIFDGGIRHKTEA